MRTMLHTFKTTPTATHTRSQGGASSLWTTPWPVMTEKAAIVTNGTGAIMTKMPGQDLMALKFWSLEEEEREERRRAFLQVLK